MDPQAEQIVSDAQKGTGLKRDKPTLGWNAILDERKRHREVHGYTETHDDSHVQGELEKAATGYARADGPAAPRPADWPFDDTPTCAWSPGSAYRNTIKAGALYVAEADRIERRRHRAQTEAGERHFAKEFARLMALARGCAAKANLLYAQSGPEDGGDDEVAARLEDALSGKAEDAPAVEAPEKVLIQDGPGD